MLLALAVVGSALAFGPHHTLPLVLVALSAAGAATLLVPARMPRVGWLLLGLAGYCLFQIVPLPFSIVSWLSPAAAGVWRGALVDLGPATPRFATLSVDPGATALEALKWSAYACALSAAAGWRAKHRSLALTLLVLGSTLLVCVITLVHGVFNLEHIYGYFRPTDVSRWVRGPFVNGNNLAGYLNLGVFATAGLAVSKRIERGTPALVSAIVLLGAGSLLASSRAGTVALALGAVLFTLLVAARRRDARRFVLMAGAVGTLGLAVAAAVSGRRVFSTLLDTQMQTKLSVWRFSLDLIGDFPVFGAGRGSFENAFLPYRQPLGTETGGIAVHAESFPLQWAADWGIPVSVAALVLLALAARRALRRATNDPVYAGLFTGLAILFIQNLADLGLELFSVSIAAVVAFAAIDEPAEPSTRVHVLRPAPIMVALAAIVVLVVGATPPQIERRAASRAYAELARASTAQLRAFKRALEPRLRRHPGDAYLPLLGAHVSGRLHENPLPWLGRALERSPTSGSAHLALAEVLAARGARQQSQLHARLAAAYDRSIRDRALARVAGPLRYKADLLDAFPDGMPGAELLSETCALVVPGLRVECRRLVLERQATPDSERALARALLEALETHDLPCRDSARDCQREALRLLDRLAGQAPRDTALSQLRARLVAFDGRQREAAVLLLEHCPGGEEAKTCVDRALEYALEAGDKKTIELATMRYAPLVCAEPPACGALHERVGRRFADLSAEASALPHFLEAARVNPTTERWLAAAETAFRLGIHSTATLALERASRDPQLSTEQTRRLTTVRAALYGTSAE